MAWKIPVVVVQDQEAPDVTCFVDCIVTPQEMDSILQILKLVSGTQQGLGRLPQEQEPRFSRPVSNDLKSGCSGFLMLWRSECGKNKFLPRYQFSPPAFSIPLPCSDFVLVSPSFFISFTTLSCILLYSTLRCPQAGVRLRLPHHQIPTPLGPLYPTRPPALFTQDLATTSRNGWENGNPLTTIVTTYIAIK
jgi:hypothetical protein